MGEVPFTWVRSLLQYLRGGFFEAAMYAWVNAPSYLFDMRHFFNCFDENNSGQAAVISTAAKQGKAL